MSKDSKGDKSFPERLKRWFKLERGNFPGNRDIRLSEELKYELSSEAPVSVRIKAIRELHELLVSRKLEENGIEKLWTLVRDLLVLTVHAEQRHATLEMLTTLAAGHDRMGPMRHVFFNYISENYRLEDLKPIFDFFREVIAEGKQLEYIDEYVGPFLLDWLPGLLSSPQAADVLNLIIILVKFNSAYLDEPVVTGFVKQVVIQLHRASIESEALLCLRVLDAVLAYSYLPSSALPTFITALTQAINVPQLTPEAWKIMRNLLGTHLGNSGLFVLCRLVERPGDPHMVRGAVFFLTSALWGANKVYSLQYKPAAVLPYLREAAKNEHILIVYEISLSIQKLVSKMYLELHLSSWDLVLDILTRLFQHTVAMEEGTEKQTILSVLKEVLDSIEQLIDLQQFGGSSERFFSLIDIYSQLRPESSVLRLLDHLAQGADPIRPHWLANLGTLLSRYYRRDHRCIVRNKALAILSDVYNNNRHTYGTEMVRNVVTIQMEGIETEQNVGVRTAAVNLLVHIIMTQKSLVVPDLLSMLEKIVLAPYQNPCETRLSENEAVDIIAAVAGLVRIFKCKLWGLPSSHAIQTYGILISCLEHHYRHQSVLEVVPRVRLQIFEMIFEMRANSKYQLGFSKLPERLAGSEEDGGISMSSLIPPFSPYIVVDHKHGQRFYQTQEKQQQQQQDEREQQDQQSVQSTVNAVKEEEDKSGRDRLSASSSAKVEVTRLSLTQAAMIVIVAMKKEKDWEVLRLILEGVPQVLQNKALILSRHSNDVDYVAAALCSLVTDKSLGLPETLHNTPSKFTSSDFQSYVFPVLASLASYHTHMDPLIQQKVIKCLELGVLSRCAGPLCVSALTLCVLEMRDSMIKLLREVILNLSKITATVQNAPPILEFLSTLLHLPKVYANFTSEQYMSVFAIAIPYTNPFKFNHYIVSLAYHVIAMWFLKCRLPFRRAFVPFISKNLSLIMTNEEAATRRRSASACTSDQLRTRVDVEMIQFHNDLRDTCIDLMSRYTFSSCGPHAKRGKVCDMLLEDGQQQTWIWGDKIITITTSGCSQRPLRNGLCDKCFQQCIEKTDEFCSFEPMSPNSPSASRRRHRSELHRTISHEAKYKPQSKDDLHMRSVVRDNDTLTSLGDQDGVVNWNGIGGSSTMDRLPFSSSLDSSPLPDDEFVDASAAAAAAAAAAAENQSPPYLCACWCQGWAEIYIRAPTGNVAWMMRLLNEQMVGPGMKLNVDDLALLFSTLPSQESGEGNTSENPYCKDLPDRSEMFHDHFCESGDEMRPRAFSGASDRTQDSDPGSQRGDSGSSGAPSHTSSDPRINTTDASEDTRGSSPLTSISTSGENPEDPRVPVQRCHSSPEMSEGVVVGGARPGAREENVMQSLHLHHSTPEEEHKTPISTPSVSPAPSDQSSSTPASRQPRRRPRFEPMLGGGSLGSTSPPPVSSTRIRHTSALQMKSEGSSSSISSVGCKVGGTTEGEDDGSPRPMRRDRGHTISDMSPASRKYHKGLIGTIKKSNSQKETTRICTTPSFVFLQLFYKGGPISSSERPYLVPTHQPEVQRALGVLDLIRAQETHKIGVLYVGPGQTTEREILSNEYGSLRYMIFLQGLGSVLELDSVSEDEVFLGGLDTKGNDGKLVYIWHDDIMQVVFHVATLIPTKESDTNFNGRKLHIGNNYVTIVYNESGKPYNLSTIKGQFNHTVVEIVQVDHSTNSVGLLCRPELQEFVCGGGSPRLVSDANLPTLVRQLALHADLASTVWESLRRPPHNPYATNWLERLRKIRKIKQMVLPEGDGRPPSSDFTDMVDWLDRERGRGGTGYWQQVFL
ncbi:hypothetical protein Pmani_018669 [Petrolisthes manimaculis]|uniref:Rap-GAP domain-containing protein n=1 Tax=Petrolisthes manimaculis TaxID=1843537 RepID=A0AAE1PMI3_9EUCA|nr:hypothetical protein Pmani_018669 [Petrolisthes manimaculis]